MREIRGGRLRLVLGWVVAAVALLAVDVAAQPLAFVRVTSIAAVLRDADTLAKATGRPVDAAQLLAGALAGVGLNDPEVLDRERPLVATMPLEGMLLQQRGVVLALPVRTAGAVLDAVARSFAARSRDGMLHVFQDAEGVPLYAAEHGTYLVLGQTRDLVRGFDGALLAREWDGPPGNVQLELFLEPLLPLLQAGLVRVREQARAELQQQLEQPQAQPLDQPLPDAAALSEMLDLYLDLAQKLLMDLSRLQVAVQVDGDYLLYHQRAVPKPGTATAEFLAAQQGDLPASGRILDPGAISMASNVVMTPRLQAATTEFLQRYLALTGQLLATLEQSPAGQAPATAGEETVAPAADAALLATYLANMEQWLVEGMGCVTGDAVASLSFTDGGGMELAEVVGYLDTPECRAATLRSLEQLTALAQAGASDPSEVAVEEFELEGLPARRIGMDVGLSLLEQDPQALALLHKLYGGTSVDNFVALDRGHMYYTAGQQGRQQLAAMLRRRHELPPVGSGIGAATFVPLGGGPGLYLSADLQRLLQFARDLTPLDQAERAQLEELIALFSGPALRAALALRFAPASASMHMAVPLRALGVAAGAPRPLPQPAGEGG